VLSVVSVVHFLRSLGLCGDFPLCVLCGSGICRSHPSVSPAPSAGISTSGPSPTAGRQLAQPSPSTPTNAPFLSVERTPPSPTDLQPQQSPNRPDCYPHPLTTPCTSNRTPLKASSTASTPAIPTIQPAPDEAPEHPTSISRQNCSKNHTHPSRTEPASTQDRF